VPYCDINAVQREMGRYGPQVTNASVPSLSQVKDLMADVAAEIDGALSARGVSVPVEAPPNPVSVKPWIEGFLRRLNAMGTAGYALNQLYGHAIGPVSTDLGDKLIREYRAIIDKLTTGDTLLPGTIVLAATGGALPRSLWTSGNPDTDLPEDIDPERGPTFTRVTPW